MNKWIELNRGSKVDIRAAAELSKKLSDRIPSEEFVCPSCNSAIRMSELIERKGSFGCVNCVR